MMLSTRGSPHASIHLIEAAPAKIPRCRSRCRVALPAWALIRRHALCTARSEVRNPRTSSPAFRGGTSRTDTRLRGWPETFQASSVQTGDEVVPRSPQIAAGDHRRVEGRGRCNLFHERRPVIIVPHGIGSLYTASRIRVVGSAPQQDSRAIRVMK